MRTSVLKTVLAVTGLAAALVACKQDTVFTNYATVVKGENVFPVISDADTATTGSVALSGSGTTFTFTLNVTTYPGATIDSVRIYAGNAGTAVANAKGTICTTTTTPACPTAAGSITGSVTGVTDTTLASIMRGYGAYVVVKTTAKNGGGAARGQVYPVGS